MTNIKINAVLRKKSFERNLKPLKFGFLIKYKNNMKGKDIINLLPVIIINKKLIIIEKFKYSFKEGKYFEILNDSIM